MPHMLTYHDRYYTHVKFNMNVQPTYVTNLILQFQDFLNFVLQKYKHFNKCNNLYTRHQFLLEYIVEKDIISRIYITLHIAT